MKLKKIIMKYVLTIIVGILLSSSVIALGDTLIESDKVEYTSDKSVQEKLENLYDEINNCPNGMFCKVIYGPTSTGATINTTSIPSDTKGLIGIAYLNPTDLTASCTSSSITASGTYTGCMKWYIYNIQIKESKTYYTMILDHNIMSGIQYNSDGTNKYSKEVTAQLNNLVNSYGWKVTPRLITADEIANITGNKNWSSATSTTPFYLGATSTSNSSERKYYYWLYDYTYNCKTAGHECKNQSTNSTGDAGYWTSSAYSGNATNVWSIYYGGNLYSYDDAKYAYVGLRPVITIAK